ncbi:MAG: hypothetical protein P1R58_13105 [bacterium]|nr:hypothetical protein [bacterium]
MEQNGGKVGTSLMAVASLDNLTSGRTSCKSIWRKRNVRSSTSLSVALKGLYQVFSNPMGLFVECAKHTGMSLIVVPYVAFAILVLISGYLSADLEMRTLLAELQRQGIDPSGLPSKSLIREQFMLIRFLMIGNPFVVSGILSLLAFLGGLKQDWLKILIMTLYGEYLFGIGLLLSSLFSLQSDNLVPALSMAPLALSAGLDKSDILTICATRVELFFVWEVMIVSIGLRVMFDCPRRTSYLLSFSSVGFISVLTIILI